MFDRPFQVGDRVAYGDVVVVPLTERITLSREGAVVGRRTEPQVMTAWSRLFHDLRAVFPRERYHNGKVLTGVSETAGAPNVSPTARLKPP